MSIEVTALDTPVTGAECHAQSNLLTALKGSPDTPARLRQCQACGQTFELTRADARFCSATCRQAAHRRREVTDNVTDVTDNCDVSDFNWDDARAEGAVVQEKSLTVACYINPHGQVVIREEANWPHDDEDRWIIISPGNLLPLINRLCELERQIGGAC